MLICRVAVGVSVRCLCVSVSVRYLCVSVSVRCLQYLLVGVLGDLNPPGYSRALGTAGHIDCVAKETVSWHPQANDPSNHLSTVDTNTHLREGGGREGGRKGRRKRGQDRQREEEERTGEEERRRKGRGERKEGDASNMIVKTST